MPIRVANDLLQTDDLVAVVAGVGRPVVEVPPCQVDLPVGRVGQFGAFLLGSDTGQAANTVAETQLAVVHAVGVGVAFALASSPFLGRSEIVSFGAFVRFYVAACSRLTSVNIASFGLIVWYNILSGGIIAHAT